MAYRGAHEKRISGLIRIPHKSPNPQVATAQRNECLGAPMQGLRQTRRRETFSRVSPCCRHLLDLRLSRHSPQTKQAQPSERNRWQATSGAEHSVSFLLQGLGRPTCTEASYRSVISKHPRLVWGLRTRNQGSPPSFRRGFRGPPRSALLSLRIGAQL